MRLVPFLSGQLLGGFAEPFHCFQILPHGFHGKRVRLLSSGQLVDLPLPGAITKCIDAGFSPSHVIGMQGPFTRELNEAMLRQVGAQWLVTKDSGTVGGTAEKLAAARDVGARCIVVTRPAEGSGALSLREVEDVLLREFAR